MIHKIMNIIGIIIVVSLAALTLGGIIYGLITNTLSTLLDLAIPVSMAVCYFVAVYLHGKLKAKQRVDWDGNDSLTKVAIGLCISTWLYLLLFICELIWGENDDAQFFILVFLLSVFSLWTYISVSLALTTSTLLVRTYLSVSLLYYSFVFCRNVINQPLQSINLIFVLLCIIICSVCVKGLCISFSDAWNQQFKNQKAPIIVIMAIFTIIFSCTFCCLHQK